MAKRYSGLARVHLTYEDQGTYWVRISLGPRTLWNARLFPPSGGFGEGVAFDSALAYDRVARAALGFADSEKVDLSDAMLELDDSGWCVHRAAWNRPLNSQPI
jgi:hypothetical protein